MTTNQKPKLAKALLFAYYTWSKRILDDFCVSSISRLKMGEVGEGDPTLVNADALYDKMEYRSRLKRALDLPMFLHQGIQAQPDGQTFIDKKPIQCPN